MERRLQSIPHLTTMVRRVCLFGLSADPPTGYGGHVGIVKALAALTKDATSRRDGGGEDDDDDAFDEIRVLPVYRHTYSDKRRRLVPFEHRFRMCQLAFDGIPGVVVSDAEYQTWIFAVKDIPPDERDTVSVGTASLLEYLHQTEPETNFTFCLGADAFMDLTAGKWKESDRVLQLFHGLLVLERKQKQKQQQQHANDSNGNSSILLHQRLQETSTPTRLWQVDQLDSVSSSQVRACTKQDELERLVVPAVLEYMQKHGLYQCASDKETPSSSLSSSSTLSKQLS